MVKTFLYALTLVAVSHAQPTDLPALLDNLAHAEQRDAVASQLRREQQRVSEELSNQNLPPERRDELETRLRHLERALALVVGDDAHSEDDIRHFETRVRPLLIEKCQKCHGAEKQSSGLRLDSRDAVLSGGSRGPALVPGAPDASLLIQAIRHAGDLQMPPRSRLEPSEVEALVEWVRQGVPWPAPPHEATTADTADTGPWWSFVPVAPVDPPDVHNAEWVRNDIDRFILARLEQEGLSPAPPADKRTLIRRASFDLIGLPPPPNVVADFLNDASPDAFARVVDRLLASPHYGERWGRHWLDVVRYTDSFDSRATPATDPINSWRYRDWVVRSFNDDMPYSDFVKYQIAGDLIPEPSQPDGFNRDGIIATGMLALGNWPQGDADKQKMVTDIVDDQIDVICRGIMGVTMSCARCHDHKFDPFSMNDYYGLAGIFFSSHILPGPGQKTEGSPILHIPLVPPSEAKAREAHVKRIEELQNAERERVRALRSAALPGLIAQTAAYLKAIPHLAALQRDNTESFTQAATAQGLSPAIVSRWIASLGLGPYNPLDTAVRDIHSTPGVHAWQKSDGLPSAVFNTNSTDATYLTIKQPGKSVAVHPKPDSGVAVVWKNPAATNVVVSGSLADADANCGNGVAWRLELRSDNSTRPIADGEFDNGGSASIAPAEHPLGPFTVTAGDSLSLVVQSRGDHACDTTVVHLNVTDVCDDTLVWSLTEVLTDPLRANPAPDAKGSPDVWWFVDTVSSSVPAAPALAAYREAIERKDADATAARADEIQNTVNSVVNELASLGGDLSKLPDRPDTVLYKHLVSDKSPYAVDPMDLAMDPTSHGELAQLRRELTELRAKPMPEVDFAEGIQEGGVPGTEHEGIRDARIHKRGTYTQLGDVVPRRFPAVLASGPPPPFTGSGRLQLAEWVASPDNPLTARVMVNRIWQHHFGEGIVRTPGNFGKQGTPPTHPELLDYLAREFVRSNWSIKSMHRLIMLSATYQQAASPASPTDPDNLWFGRMNRRRVEAEVLRDAMLAVAGRLDPTVGGPAFRDLNTPRRTLYYRTVRSDRTSFTMLFDAADPTAIIDKRTESIVAPQALFLMNNPFVIEQAGALADRVLAQPDAALAAQSGVARADANRVAMLYELLFARPPRDAEIAVAHRVIGDAVAANHGDLANAWQQYCQILLCSNEFAFID